MSRTNFTVRLCSRTYQLVPKLEEEDARKHTRFLLFTYRASIPKHHRPSKVQLVRLRCRGWNEHLVVQFIDKRMGGCRYGRSPPRQFSWKILTSCNRLQRCRRNHQHEWLQGDATTCSAYYPTAMCTAIAHACEFQLLPARSLSMDGSYRRC